MKGGMKVGQATEQQRIKAREQSKGKATSISGKPMKGDTKARKVAEWLAAKATKQ